MSAAHILLCGKKSNLNDDLVGFCAACALVVYVRPQFAKIEHRICFECACVMVRLSGNAIQNHFVLPHESIEDAIEAFRVLWVKST